MSAANLQLVAAATQNPGSCLLCASTPVDETKEHKPSLPFVHAVGMDVNWGDSVYICWHCCGLIADLVDRPEEEKVKAVLRGARLQKKANEKLVTENEELKTALLRMLAGESASEKAKELVQDG